MIALGEKNEKGDFQSMIALGYIRRSKKSDDKTVSLPVQRAHVSDYCKRVGFALVDFISDDGVSGGKRSRFDRLDEAVKQFSPGALVYYNQDRIARDVGLGEWLATLRKRGIEVHESAGGGKVDLDHAIGRMIINLRSSVDQGFREVIGEKTAEALALLRDNGRRYTNVPPLGWRYVDGAMVPDPEEQHGLDVLKRCAAAGLGSSRAIKVLDAGGYRGRRSRCAIERALSRIKRGLP